MGRETFAAKDPAAKDPAAKDPAAGHAVVGRPLPHESAAKHVTGSARYIDDLAEPAGTLHVAIGMAPVARGRIETIELGAVRAAPGVVRVFTAADVPGKNDISPAFGDEPLLAECEILFHGQAVFAVVGETRDAARKAARLGRVNVAVETPSVDIAAALARNETVMPDYAFGNGDADAAIAAARHRLDGSLRTGGQEHFYLEGQVALAIPGEDGDLHVFSSTQHPTEVQHVVARVLGLADHAVIAECRRMGGGFGGKESQATQWAAMAALAAQLTQRPCKLRLDRDDDFALTGKRHDFVSDFALGYADDGTLAGLSVTHHARCGCSADLSLGVVDRTMFHTDNAYFLPHVTIGSRRLKTNTVSNTAFRGFGGPQGMLAIERIVEMIAQSLGRDPFEVRRRNLYAPGRDITPYGMKVEETDILSEIFTQCARDADYATRRADIVAYNAAAPVLRKGIAVTPVKFGISFTLKHLNQAGALVHVYGDGSVHLNHGGTEMGQGLFIKVAQVVAEVFGLPIERIKVSATTTAKVPNTAPTAASSGSDLNGMAALDAAQTIRDRMAEVAAAVLATPANQIIFRDGQVFGGNASFSFTDLAKRCVLERVSLSATGFYRTPGITWDRASKTGRPFLYFAYGAACAEVTIDTMTGESRVDRVDILHDAGASLNPAIDIGQIEGGFVQGMGWLTTEELVYAADGRLLTHAPATYKIPVASDVPEHFNTQLYDRPNRTDTIFRSKAVGEPPLMLANAVFCALMAAVHSLNPARVVSLDAPATPEALLRAVRAQRG